MKAIRVHKFGGPEVLQLDDVPDPKPGPGQVVVRIRAAGVNPVDTYIRSGSYAMLPTLPYVPGNDCAGVIETVGQGVTGFKRGDRVYVVRTTTPMAGGYAELALCEASTVHPLPANVSFSQGAGVSVPYGTAYRGLHHKAHARSGETLLVHGASGGVGIAAVQLGVAHGMTVVGTAGTERGRKLVPGHGGHHPRARRRSGAAAQGGGARPRGGAEAGSLREDRPDPLTGRATSCRPGPSWRAQARGAWPSRAASSPPPRRGPRAEPPRAGPGSA